MYYPVAPAIPQTSVPQAAEPLLQHAIDTYASETNKVFMVWTSFEPANLEFRPDPKSTPVEGIFRHQLLSERRFFGEFLGSPEPSPDEVLPAASTDPREYAGRLIELALPRLPFLAAQDAAWWTERVKFFDVERERIWIFWRRILHTAHHRTQLSMYQRMLGLPVQPVYGPTADVRWEDADPTNTVAAAGRK